MAESHPVCSLLIPFGFLFSLHLSSLLSIFFRLQFFLTFAFHFFCIRQPISALSLSTTFHIQHIQHLLAFSASKQPK